MNQYTDLLALMQVMNANTQANNQPRTVNIGGNNILDNTPRGGLNALPGILNSLTTGLAGMEQTKNKQSFFKGVKEISADSVSTPDDKINKLIGLMAEHGTDYGLGIDKIVDQYGKMNRTSNEGWKPQTKEEALEFENAKAKTKVEINNNNLTPAERRQKNLDTTKLITAANENIIKKDMLKEAKDASKTVWTGIKGKARQSYSKLFNPNDPMLGEWQKIKMVLTDAQLLNTAKTKGAISDKEMELFANAAANDDLSSIPRIMPVINKLERFMAAEEKSMADSYFANYGEQAPVSMGQINNAPSIGQTFNGQKIKNVRRIK